MDEVIPDPIDLTSARLLWRARPATDDRAAWAGVWGLNLCYEVERLRLALDSAERGVAYWQRSAQDQDTKTYRALVERTAERDAARARTGRDPGDRGGYDADVAEVTA